MRSQVNHQGMTALDSWRQGSPIGEHLRDDRYRIRVFVVSLVVLGAAIAGLYASPLLLAGLVGTLSCLVILRKPAMGLVILVMASTAVPFEVQASASVYVNISFFVVPLLLAVWLFDMLRRRELYWRASLVNMPLLGFVFSATVSWILGNLYWEPLVPRPGNILWVQLGQWSIYVFSAIVFWLGANLLRDVRSLKLVTFAFLFLGGTRAVLFAIPALHSAASWLAPAGSASSLHWTWLAAVAAGQLLFNPKLSFTSRVFCCITLALLFLFSLRQISWVSGILPVSVTVGVLVSLRYRSKSVGLVVVLVVLALAYGPSLYHQLGLDQELATSGGGRVKHYQIVVELALRRPWFGLGMAAYRHYSWTMAGEVASLLFRGAQISSHNNYLDIFAQMGIVGLLVFVWLASTLGRLAWRLKDRFSSGFEAAYVYTGIAGLAGTLVGGLLGDWFLPFVYNIGLQGFRSSAMAWLFLGGLVALDAISTRSTPLTSSASPQ